MSLYLYTQPIEHSLFDDFEDDFFNYPLTKRHHYFTFNHPRHNFHRHNHCKNSCNTLEKQLSRALKDNELFQIADFSPKINLSEDEKNYYIHADLPGMTKDQVKMELNDDRVLTISGERKSIYDNSKESEDDNKMETDEEENESEEKNKNEGKQKTTNESTTESTRSKKSKKENKKENEKDNEISYSMVECSYGKFSRSFSIPEDADLENIQAKMENGVLEVVFNKIATPKHQNRTIQIQ